MKDETYKILCPPVNLLNRIKDPVQPQISSLSLIEFPKARYARSHNRPPEWLPDSICNSLYIEYCHLRFHTVWYQPLFKRFSDTSETLFVLERSLGKV